jgi:hypothetical protein
MLANAGGRDYQGLGKLAHGHGLLAKKIDHSEPLWVA